MNRTQLLTAKSLLAGAVLASPFLLSFERAGDKVTFAPAEGKQLTKSFVLEQNFNVDDMSMAMNGEDFPMEMEMDMEMTQTVTVTDTYEGMADGKPSKLIREYKEGSMDMNVDVKVAVMGQNQDQSQEMEGTSQLKDKKVVFTWNDEKGEYEIKFHEDSAGEPELLGELLEDMDLRGLLPEAGKEVSVDDEWTPRKDIVADIFAAGGNLQWEIEGGDVDSAMGGGPDPEMMSNLRALLSDSIDGDLRCKYTGTKEVDGKTFQRIEVTLDIKSVADLLEYVQAAMEETELPPGASMPEIGQMEMTTEMDGKGVLLWDSSAGVMHSFTYEGRLAMAMEMSMTMDAMGQEMEMEMSMEMSGDMKLEVTTE